MKKDKIGKDFFGGMISGGLIAVISTALIFSNNQSASLTTTTNSLADAMLKKNYISQEDLVVSAVESATPAVVSIVITKDVPKIEKFYSQPQGDPLLEGLYGYNPFSIQIPQYKQNGTEKKEVGGGSGFLVSDDGFIVTNKHVVSDTDAQYTVFLNNGTKFDAKVLTRDPLNDVAFLKIEATNLSYLEFADSDTIKPGQTAIAIGNPLMEFNNSVSVGVVSGLSRSIVANSGFGQSEQLEGVIQTDAAINPGNSGGPLLNLNGKVIGVNVAVANAQGIGFSLPGNLIKNAYESVKVHGKIFRAYLGVRYVQITEKLKEANKLDIDYGVLINKGKTEEELAVIPGSPADKAGLVENDIILEVDGVKLEEGVSLAKIVAGKIVGDTVKLKVLSKGVEKEVEVKLEELAE